MNFDEELQAIRDNIDYVEWDFPRYPQLQTLGSLMSKGISPPKVREKRIAILRMIAGETMMRNFNIEVNSSKDLTAPIVAYLINQFKSPMEGDYNLNEYGREFLRIATERVEVQVTGLKD